LGLADAYADTGTDEFTEMERSLAEAGTALRAVAPPLCPVAALTACRGVVFGDRAVFTAAVAQADRVSAHDHVTV